MECMTMVQYPLYDTYFNVVEHVLISGFSVGYHILVLDIFLNLSGCQVRLQLVVVQFMSYDRSED